MIHADCPPGVAAGTLDSTVQHLRSVLAGYREELNQATHAFEDWEHRWNEQQRSIDAHLALIQSRLAAPSTGPSLTIVRADE